MAEHRRAVDEERRRWNDEALDQLAARVHGAEARVETWDDHIVALAGLPQQLLDLKAAFEDQRRQARDAARLEERRVTHIRKDHRELRKQVSEHFAEVHEAHERAEKRASEDKRGVDWKFLLAVAGTIVVPIVIAIIALAASLSGKHP